MGIEVFLASEDFGSNLVLLRRYTGMLEGVVGQILEKLAEGLRAMEGAAAEQSFDVRELLGSIRHTTPHKKSVTAL
jgi:hypothetical protein